MHDEETVPYARTRDDLRGPDAASFANGPSMKRQSSRYSDDEMPTFDEEDARRAKFAHKKNSPLERFKSERPPERDTLREQMFREVEVSLSPSSMFRLVM